MLRKRVHEAVRGGVVSLPDIAHRAGYRGEQREKVQINLTTSLIQVDRARHFRREYGAEFRGRLLQDEVVRDHSGTMQNAVELPVLFPHRSDESPDRLRLRDVQLPVLEPLRPHVHRLQLQARLRRQRSAARQDHPPARGLRKNFSSKQHPQPAQASGYQVYAPILECHWRYVVKLRCRLPPQDIASTPPMPNDRILRALRVGTQPPREFCRRGVWVTENNLAEQLRVLQRRSPQQARQSQQQCRLSLPRRHDLQQHFALGTTRHNRLDHLQASRGAFAVSGRQRLRRKRRPLRSVALGQQRAQSLGSDFRKPAEHHVMLGILRSSRR